MIVVSAPSRLHFGLLDMTGLGSRIYGGAGVAIRQPNTEVELVKGKNKIDGAINKEQVRAISSLLARLDLPQNDCNIYVRQVPPAHQGFGSKTALLLAIAYGANRLYSLGYNRKRLIAATGRGGASGIGCWSFFFGGVIVDAGRPRNDVSEILPSSATYPATPSLMISRHRFPKTWRIALLPAAGNRMVGDLERMFFRKYTPIPPIDSLKAIALMHQDIIPSLLSGDLAAFSLALRLFNSIGFKRLELAGQSQAVTHCLTLLWESRIAAGMSSMGPLIYCVFDSDKDAARISEIAQRCNISAQFVTPDNHGACIHVSS